MFVGGRHDSVRLALTLIVLLLAAVSSAIAVTSSQLEVSATRSSVSSVQVRVMLDRQTCCDDFVSCGG